MKRKIIIAVTLVVLIAVFSTMLTACTRTTRSNPTGTYQIVRSAPLGANYQMYQIRITLQSGSDFDIDLIGLAGTDKVDGYFYPEKGSGGTLEIKAGNNVIYKVDTATLSVGGTLSDRFAFPANQPAGTAYVLNFHNGGTETVTEFVELIYPKTGSIRGPIDLK